jgi:kynurenine formamidase
VLWTGHDAAYGVSADFGGHRAFIATDGAEWLARQNPGVVVTDLVGLDEPIDVTEPVHNILLHAGVRFLQVATNLGGLATGEWTICAFPTRIVGGTGAPLRAFAVQAA